MRTAGCAALLLLAFCGPARAGDADPKQELNSDRPDFTEGSITVPAGRLQLETGFTFADNRDGTRELSGPELLLRYGVGKRTELRFVGPDYGFQRGRSRASGWGDAAIGFKQQLGPVGPWDFAVLAHAFLPTGSSFSSGRVDPDLELAWARKLSEKWSVAGLLGFTAPSEPEGRNPTFIPTVSFSRSLSGRWDAFLEYAAQFPQRGGSVQVIHHGYAYALSKSQQLDVHFGFGLTPAAPDFFIGGGYAVRF